MRAAEQARHRWIRSGLLIALGAGLSLEVVGLAVAGPLLVAIGTLLILGPLVWTTKTSIEIALQARVFDRVQNHANAAFHSFQRHTREHDERRELHLGDLDRRARHLEEQVNNLGSRITRLGITIREGHDSTRNYLKRTSDAERRLDSVAERLDTVSERFERIPEHLASAHDEVNALRRRVKLLEDTQNRPDLPTGLKPELALASTLDTLDSDIEDRVTFLV